MSRKKLLIIDGNSIVNRAFYGVPLLTDSQGRYTTDFQPFVNQKQARTAIIRRSFHRHTRSCNNRILSVGDFLILLHGKKHRPNSQEKDYNPHDKTSLFDTDRRRIEK